LKTHRLPALRVVMRHNPDVGIMTELMECGPVPIDRFEISRRRWHLHEIARHIVVGARAADAEIRSGCRNQRLGSGLNLAWWRRDDRSTDLLGQAIALVRVDHAAMPYEDVAAFVAKLRKHEAASALALELCVLTAARSGEILGMRWSEIELDKKIWTVPANRMKAGREHRVPLVSRAVAILRKLENLKTGAFVFPGQTRDKPLSNMAMEMVLRRMKVDDATVHGFRSSFRDWAGNVSSFPREIVETALSHVIGDKAEQAYRRSDALDKPRKLMEAWATYCEPRDIPNIVRLTAKQAR
jgi:integrase